MVSVASCSKSDPEPAQPKLDGPSVLLITLDTTRADHLGCYGYSKETSPRLDELASNSALFTKAISQAAVTPVSHASILTGLDPYSHGLRVMHGVTENTLPDSCETLAEVLQRAGYRTAAFISAFPVATRFGFDQGFEVFDEDFMRKAPDQLISKWGVVNTGKNQRRADLTTNRAIQWLAKKPDPFLLWVHYFDPHDPQVLPPNLDISTLTGNTKQQLIQIYDQEIRFMDGEIGRLLDELERHEHTRDTIVVVVADHGEGLGDHNWWSHGILYQEQIRVPLIIRESSRRIARRIDHCVRTTDIMPTVLELAGLDEQYVPLMNGKSLVPLLSDASNDPDYMAYSDSVNLLNYNSVRGLKDVKDDMLFCVMDKQWKYIHHLLREDESELYDLSTDPKEQRNLYKERPDLVKRLLADLKARDFAPSASSQKGRMSKEDIDRLKSLGYIE